MEFVYWMRSVLYPESCGTPVARVVGLVMSHEDMAYMACLHDVYQTVDEDATTKNTIHPAVPFA